jgi:hypothetical protein
MILFRTIKGRHILDDVSEITSNQAMQYPESTIGMAENSSPSSLKHAYTSAPRLYLVPRPSLKSIPSSIINSTNAIRRTTHSNLSLGIRGSLTSRTAKTLRITNRCGDHPVDKRRVRREGEDRVIGGNLTSNVEFRGAVELYSDG